jgi:peptidylprolyl isomerase domain and WD repeat-containing protein 1
MQQAGTTIFKVDDMEFGRRLAVERELELPGPDGKIPGMWMNAIWDESGSFIIYPTLLGIKSKRHSNPSQIWRLTCLMILVVNTVSNKVVRLLGKDETVRWMNLAIYQGQPAKKSLSTLVSKVNSPVMLSDLTRCPTPQAMAASSNPLLAEKAVRDPTLFCTGYKRQRFYMFTRSEPE